MSTASVRVAADRSAQLTVGDAVSEHPDLGAAMAQLVQAAKAAGEDITAQIHDGQAVRTITIESGGRISAAPPTEPAPGAAADPATGPGAQAGSAARLGAAGPSAPRAPSAAGVPSAPGAPSAASEAPAQSRAEPAAGQESAYPVGTPFSGPAEPTRASARASKRSARRAERAQRSAPARRDGPGAGRAKRGALPQLRGLTMPGIVLAILLVGALAAYFVPTIIGAPGTGAPQSISAASSQAQQSEIRVEDSSEPVPGYAEEPAWQAKVESTASVTATARGVLVIDEQKLRVLDPRSGDQRYGGSLDGRLDFAVDTTIDGRKALLWRTGRHAQALFDGTSAPVDYTLPAGARLSSAGSSVLVKAGNSLSTFTGDGMRNIPTPPAGSTPMALDDDRLISAEFRGPLISTDIATGQTTRIALEKPEEGLEIIRWVSAGHGKVVTLWGQPGASTNSGHRIQLVVSEAETGMIASTVSTSTDAVGEASWVRGQNYEHAVIGPYLFNMRSGLLVRDGSEADVRFSEPRGTLTPVTVDGAACLLSGSTAFRTQTNLLALTEGAPGYAIVRQGSDRVVGYPEQG
ncbi:hypothetical protein BRM1_06250 [Brevibacterium sp. BRM-1]|uniref:hypothetical protein n=1 Tax=Brevibacterium sp. BRM-1 TaxID=2999062 RepID=UPI002280A5EE|nr:hypothetical protein [Brevibacterium sp. BRM-1]WAL41439.1 hypothetical protein BRM1_06250 [Brevibacterium sp. BRM-1]